MPYYDLRCKTCQQEFTTKASISDKSEQRIPCPECGSKDLATVFNVAPTYVRSGSGSEPVSICANSKECGASCPHSRSA